MSKKINVDLISLEQKRILDLHGLTIEEVRVLLDNEFETIKIDKTISIKVFVLLHGYSKGEVLKKYLREEYINSGIKQKEWGQNPGTSYYIIKEYKRK